MPHILEALVRAEKLKSKDGRQWAALGLCGQFRKRRKPRFWRYPHIAIVNEVEMPLNTHFLILGIPHPFPKGVSGFRTNATLSAIPVSANQCFRMPNEHGEDAIQLVNVRRICLSMRKFTDYIKQPGRNINLITHPTKYASGELPHGIYLKTNSCRMDKEKLL